MSSILDEEINKIDSKYRSILEDYGKESVFETVKAIKKQFIHSPVLDKEMIKRIFAYSYTDRFEETDNGNGIIGYYKIPTEPIAYYQMSFIRVNAWSRISIKHFLPHSGLLWKWLKKCYNRKFSFEDLQNITESVLSIINNHYYRLDEELRLWVKDGNFKPHLEINDYDFGWLKNFIVNEELGCTYMNPFV